jgi:hypothetical protein
VYASRRPPDASQVIVEPLRQWERTVRRTFMAGTADVAGKLFGGLGVVLGAIDVYRAFKKKC